MGLRLARLQSFAYGFVGVLLALLLYHAYTDHVALHTMLNFLNQHGEKIQRLP